MKSVRDVYIIGNGPSSSHTMGPSFAIDYVLNKYPNLDKIEVILCGSLAFTSKGHLTDKIIDEKLSDVNHKITFDYKRKVEHPNTLFCSSQALLLLYRFQNFLMLSLFVTYKN